MVCKVMYKHLYRAIFIFASLEIWGDKFKISMSIWMADSNVLINLVILKTSSTTPFRCFISCSKVVASMSFSCVSQPSALMVHGREEPVYSSDCPTLVSQVISLMMERDCNETAAGLVQFLFFFQLYWDNWHIVVYKLEKEMASHFGVLDWRIPGTGEPGGLPSMGSHRVKRDWSDLAAAAAVYKFGTPLQYSCLENPMDRGAWKPAVHGVTEGWTWLSKFAFTFHFHALEKEMATHSSVLAWRIPGKGEPGGLPSMGSHRVRHDWSDLAAVAAAAFSYC